MSIRFTAVGMATLLLTLSPAAAQSDPGSCGCSCGVLVDAGGNLNPEHCNAGRVIEIMGRYATRLADILPSPDDVEDFETVDLEAVESSLEELRLEATEVLLTLMTGEEMESFGFPQPEPEPGGGGENGPFEWNGMPTTACLVAMDYINDAAEEMELFDPVYLFSLEIQLQPHCQLSLYSSFALGRWIDAFHAINSAVDQMSNGLPGAASFNSAFTEYSASAAAFALLVHYHHFTQQDPACSVMLSWAARLEDAAIAARRGSDWAQMCYLGF